MGFSGKDKVIDTLNDSSEFIWEGTSEMVNNDEDGELEEMGVGDELGVGEAVAVWVDVGAGVDVVSVKDQTVLQLLQLLHVSSRAITLQYQVPKVSCGV